MDICDLCSTTNHKSHKCIINKFHCDIIISNINDILQRNKKYKDDFIHNLANIQLENNNTDDIHRIMITKLKTLYEHNNRINLQLYEFIHFIFNTIDITNMYFFKSISSFPQLFNVNQN